MYSVYRLGAAAEESVGDDDVETTDSISWGICITCLTSLSV